MANGPINVTSPAAYGVNMAEEVVTFSEKNAGHLIQSAGNLRIHNNRYRTAYPWKELAQSGAPDDLARWNALHTQQAIFYLPNSGQGNSYLGKGVPRIVESAGGRMFTLTPLNDTFIVKDISGGRVVPDNMMIAWMAQGENYIVRTDGFNETLIYDGSSNVFFSPGYNQNAKTQARFPNGAGPVVYAGGRFWVAIFSRQIIASDSLHEVDQITAVDLLNFTDQTYDYLNVSFSPPAGEGDLIALCVSISAGFQDSRAQGEVLAMTSGPSIWAIQLGIPREQWPTANMRTTRSVETGATGQNAFCVRDGDILMRTTRGIESCNLLARERTALGNPAIDLGADLHELLIRDDEPSLLFASMINPPALNRLLCTVSPVVIGRRHYHLGYITANWNPTNERVSSGFAWEGIGTLPYAMGRVVHFLTERVDGDTQIYALLDKGDGKAKGLAMLTMEEGDNLLADGTSVPVGWFLKTKRLAPGGLFATSGFGGFWLLLADARTDINVRIFIRSNIQMTFKEVKRVELKVNPSKDDPFNCHKSGERMIPLGKLAADAKNIQWIQVVLRGEGVCTVDLSIKPDDQTSLEEKSATDCIVVESNLLCDDADDPFYYAMP